MSHAGGLGEDERLRLMEAVVVHANDAVVITEAEPIDPPGPCIIYVNEAFTRMTGYEPGEVLGKTPRLLQGPKTDPAQRARIRAALEKGEPVRVELVNYRKDGTEYWAELSIVPIADDSGRVTHFVSVKRETSDRKRSEQELREALSLLESTLESTCDGLLVVDANMRTRRFNRKFVEMWRVPPEILETLDDRTGLQYALSQLKHPEGFIDRVMQLYADPEAESYDVLELKDGRILERYSQPHRVEGRPVGRVFTFRDVTESRRGEDALRRSEARNRALLSALPDPMFVISRDGTFLDYQAAKAFQPFVPPDRFLGRNLTEVMPEHVATLGMEKIGRALDTGETQFSEYQLEADGESRHYESRLVACGEDEVISFVRDITERKRAEEALRRANETLRAVALASPVAIWALDTDGRVLFWNPAAERIFGWTEQEVLGRRTPVVPEDQLDDLRDLLERYKRGEMVAGMERRRRRKDGSPIDIAFWTAPLRDASGAITGHLGVVLDITERKRLEEQFREAQKMEVVGRLAGGVAHDFNNLLTVLAGYGQMLLDQLPAGDPRHGAAEEIMRATERAAGLTTQLLTFSRRQVVQRRVLDLNAAIADMEKMLRRVIGEDIELVTGLEASGRIKADRSQIEQVLTNLAVNARDAMPDGGVLTIESADVNIGAGPPLEQRLPTGGYVLLLVRDTGLGMDERVKRHLFEPFFTTKEIGKGTGLGLFTVYGIVKQSGGEIVVHSEMGRGTTFAIYFPRLEQAEETTPAPHVPDLTAGGSETILLVEDEAAVRHLIQKILPQQGYVVLEAEDGQQALSLCTQHTGPIHLLLTDVVMPGASGGQLAAVLGALRPDMKVLYMSGYADDAIVRCGVLAAGTAFLQKPFTPAELRRKVREVLDGSG